MLIDNNDQRTARQLIRKGNASELLKKITRIDAEGRPIADHKGRIPIKWLALIRNIRAFVALLLALLDALANLPEDQKNKIV